MKYLLKVFIYSIIYIQINLAFNNIAIAYEKDDEFNNDIVNDLQNLVDTKQIYPKTAEIILNDEINEIYGLVGNFEYSLYVNNMHIELQNPLVLYENRIFMPLRELGDLVLAEVYWNSKYRVAILETVNIYNEVKRIEVPLHTNKANIVSAYNEIFSDNIYYIDDTNKNLTSIVVDGRSYLPLRFIAENLYFTVTYFDDFKEVHLTSKEYEVPEASVGYIKAKEEEQKYMEAIEKLKEYSFTEDEILNLDTMIAKYGAGVSVYYKDILSGYTYMNNEDKKYFIASIIKAPFCMYIYELASKGELDLTTKYTYSSRHYSSGTGILKTKAFGTSYTLNELLSYAIIYSDNASLNIFKEVFGTAGYIEYATALGLNYPEDIKNITGGDITAIDCGVYIEAIYEFINTNIYGEKLRKDMLSTSNPMIVANYPVVRKYGWSDENFHDMAIVEATNPYLLCILTNKDGNYGIFSNISRTIETYSQKEDRNIEIDIPDSIKNNTDIKEISE